MTPFKKMLVLSVLAGTYSSCALLPPGNSHYVASRVTSYSDKNFENALEKKPTLNFVSASSDDIRFRSENQDMIESCREAADALGIKNVTDSNDCDGCINVLVLHKFEHLVEEGNTQMSCSSFYGRTYGMSNCYTYRPVYTSNNRWVGLTFFDPRIKKTVHQVDAYSQGSVRSVIKVAREMCYAALQDFPDKMEDVNYRISLGLAEETNRRPSSERK